MMDELTARTLDSPDETATFDNGRLATTTVGDVTFMLGSVGPGWQWSRDQRACYGNEELSHLP